MQRRRTVILIVVLSLAPAFVATRTLVAGYRESRSALAKEWATRGERHLADARPRDAVDDFRTALSYSVDAAYRLRLAEALIAAGRYSEAEAHLLTLWSAEPGDGTINLQLGRIAAERGDIPAAVRYYHAAIDGAWSANAAVARRDARFELARRLLVAGQKQSAQAELIALEGEVPDDSSMLTDLGELLVASDAGNRALTVFRRALAVAPDNRRAALLAGVTAFGLRDFDAARRYLREAAGTGPLDPAASDDLALSERVLALDPFARGIPLRERARRTLAVFDVARARLEGCRFLAEATAVGPQPPSTDPSSVENAQPQPAPWIALRADVDRLTPQLVRRRVEGDDELFDEALETAFRIERLPDSACGAPSIDDRAVRLLAGERQGSGR